jgi:hypothetical protein
MAGQGAALQPREAAAEVRQVEAKGHPVVVEDDLAVLDDEAVDLDVESPAARAAHVRDVVAARGGSVDADPRLLYDDLREDGLARPQLSQRGSRDDAANGEEGRGLSAPPCDAQVEHLDLHGKEMDADLAHGGRSVEEGGDAAGDERGGPARQP